MGGCLSSGQRTSEKKFKKQKKTHSLRNNTRRTDTKFERKSSTTVNDDHKKFKAFKYKELNAATRNFHDDVVIEKGGYGSVHKGKLSNGEVVVVKRLSYQGLQNEREFLREIIMLSLLYHPNLVKMFGYCSEGIYRFLVLEFMPMGSLETHLHDLPPDKEALDWDTRIKIAAGVARGLDFLHNKVQKPIIYRDLKASNILLGKEFHPKLSHFGLAVYGPTGDKSHVFPRVMPTYGYCAPEYSDTHTFTAESDTYSFGVILLEIISGRKACNLVRSCGRTSLSQWLNAMLNDREHWLQLADPKLNGQFPKSDLELVVTQAAECLREDANDRPGMHTMACALDFLMSKRHGCARIQATDVIPISSRSPMRRSRSPRRSTLGPSPRTRSQSPRSSPLSSGPKRPPLSSDKSSLSPKTSSLSLRLTEDERRQAMEEAGYRWPEKKHLSEASSSRS